MKVVVRTDWKKEHVAVITGGGTGHEPADVEYVGEGMLTAVACGPTLRAPTSDSVLQAIAAVTGDPGCLLIVKNYIGDRMGFNLAMEQAEKKFGYKVRAVYVGDDVVSMTKPDDRSSARGVAGVVLVQKIAGAAAAAGLTLEEVHQEAEAAAKSIASMGVAYSRGTHPTHPDEKPVPEDSMEVGIGVHSEPGWMRVPAQATAKDIVDLMLARLQPFVPSTGPLCVLLNNLGSVPKLEMSILAKQVMESNIAPRIALFAGPAPYYTVLNTNGFSLSLLPLDNVRKARLLARTACTGWITPVVPASACTFFEAVELPADFCLLAKPSKHPDVYRLLQIACQDLIQAEDELNHMSAKVGTGKLGRTLAYFARQLLNSLDKLPMKMPSEFFALLCYMCNDQAGVLFSLGRLVLSTAASELQGRVHWELSEVVSALRKGAREAQKVCGVGPNMRTFFDALIPALEAEICEETIEGMNTGFRKWIAKAGLQARISARATAHMVNAAGLAAYTPLAQRAGTPDGGAVAIATLFTSLESPLEGSFRQLMCDPFAAENECSVMAEEAAQKEFAASYRMSDEVLGEGSYSRVRSAVALQGPIAGQEVAIRELHSKDIEELGVKEFRHSLVMERRRLLNWLFTPKDGIVQVFEVVCTPHRYFYVMEKLQGPGLLEVLESEERLSYKRIADILKQMLTALRELHRSRLVHRDIKPENFRYDSSGNLKLIDVCGMLCHLVDSYENEHGNGAICGTLAYMAPEALRGAGRQAADMWAIGVILHLMLIGSHPFEATTIEEAKMQYTQPLDFTSGPWEKVPRHARILVGRLFEINARSRITVEEALEDPWVSGDLDLQAMQDESERLAVASHTLHRRKLLSRKPVTNANNSNKSRRMETHDGFVTKTLYLIRHGEAVHNVEEREAAHRAAKVATSLGHQPGTAGYQAAIEAERKSVLKDPQFHDASLTDAGKLHALRAKTELVGLHDRGLPRPTVVLVSPLQRTLQTAALMFPFHSSVRVCEELRERRTGLPCDARTAADLMKGRESFQLIDFREVSSLDAVQPHLSQAAPEEAKADLRMRTAEFLAGLLFLQTQDSPEMGPREHEAIGVVTHKGFLRELERGPLGHPSASEFTNCEIRVYQVRWSPSGEVHVPARCLYSNASLCTLRLRHLPLHWILPPGVTNIDDVKDMPSRVKAVLGEYGSLRQEPQVEVHAAKISATAVFVDQSSAATAAQRLHGLDSRLFEEKQARPTPHEADRISARLLYDIEHEEWTASSERLQAW